MASIEHPKARHVSASEGLCPLAPNQGLCHLHIALLMPFHYLIPFMTFVR